MTTSKKLSFQERELEILRNAVDRVEKQTARAKINSPQIKKIIEKPIDQIFICSIFPRNDQKAIIKNTIKKSNPKLLFEEIFSTFGNFILKRLYKLFYYFASSYFLV